MLHRLRQHPLRSPLVQLLLVAMMVRALVPVGFMPAAENGWPALQICGPAAALLAVHEGVLLTDSGTTHPGSTQEACPFALSPAAAPMPRLSTAAVFIPVASPAPDDPALAPAARAAPDAHRPRGPPSPI
jgi:hypothetical protein